MDTRALGRLSRQNIQHRFDSFSNLTEYGNIYVPCRFEGDWSAGMQEAFRLSKKTFIEGGAPDLGSKTGERNDVTEASGEEKISNLYHTPLTTADYDKATDTVHIARIDNPLYDVFWRMIDYLEMDIDMVRIHIQRLGQCSPMHLDDHLRRHAPKWRRRWAENGLEENPLKLRRFLIMLQDWEPGHTWHFGNSEFANYKAGTAMTFDWPNVPHGTANFSFNKRYTMQITGIVSEKTQWLIDNPDPNRVIEV